MAVQPALLLALVFVDFGFAGLSSTSHSEILLRLMPLAAARSRTPGR